MGLNYAPDVGRGFRVRGSVASLLLLARGRLCCRCFSVSRFSRFSNSRLSARNLLSVSRNKEMWNTINAAVNVKKSQK